MLMASASPANSCWDVGVRLFIVFVDATELWEIGVAVKEGFGSCFVCECNAHASGYAFRVSSAP